MKEVVDGKLDHQDLNKVFREKNPTSEYVAEWVFNVAVAELENTGEGETAELNIIVEQVRVWETENSSCIYTRESWLAQK